MKTSLNTWRTTIAAILFLSLIQACDDPFSYSPFEADVRPSFRDLNASNLEKISRMDTTADSPFKVALISDTHFHFNKLADAIDDINSKGDYSFIIVTGDITENGLLKEYEIFHQIMSDADIPYITVIGNHDHLSNGALIYQKMYGPLNFTFAFKHVKFVAWNNTVWESDREPDMSWLDEALGSSAAEDTTYQAQSMIIVSHIELHNDQLHEQHDELVNILAKHSVSLALNGHGHTYYTGVSLNNLPHVTIGSVQHRGYAELVVNGHEIMINKIDY